MTKPRHALTPVETTCLRALTQRERDDCYKAALDSLTPAERLQVERQFTNLMENMQMIRQSNGGPSTTGLGIGGAREVLAMLGAWLAANPAQLERVRWEPDDLEPETQR